MTSLQGKFLGSCAECGRPVYSGGGPDTKGNKLTSRGLPALHAAGNVNLAVGMTIHVYCRNIITESQPARGSRGCLLTKKPPARLGFDFRCNCLFCTKDIARRVETTKVHRQL